MEILLHICCGVCLIYPFKVLKEKGFKIKGFFYNPNIHPFSEYKKRKETLEELNKELNLEIFYPEYRPQDFFREINFSEAKEKRCPLCWRLRFKNTAEFAKKNNFKYFSTTLLVSPYQNQERLKEIGNSIAKDLGIEFYYDDFRGGFKEAYTFAKNKDLYCQRYCGCIYSEIERWKR
ncbi:MAG: epoxyqueuosine reductase QueH [Candidatus Omnitrophica bacterium]|nr:epoxyqueuosine reductase QueH [Candidatus Omnitrophota bacterium]